MGTIRTLVRTALLYMARLALRCRTRAYGRSRSDRTRAGTHIARRRRSNRRRGYSSAEVVVVIFTGRAKQGRPKIRWHDLERLPHVNDHTFPLVRRCVRKLRRLFSRKTIRVIYGKKTLCHNCVLKVFSVFSNAKLIELLKQRGFSCRIVPYRMLQGQSTTKTVHHCSTCIWVS